MGAGAGAEAAAIGRAILLGGRPEGEAAPGSVAARAGGSRRLENVSLRRERGRAARAAAVGLGVAVPRYVAESPAAHSGIPAAVTDGEPPKLILEVGRGSRPCLRRGCWEVGLLP